MSTIIAASRDSFAYMTSGRTRLLASVICKWGITALKSSPLLFIWVSNLIEVVSFIVLIEVGQFIDLKLSAVRLS